MILKIFLKMILKIILDFKDFKQFKEFNYFKDFNDLCFFIGPLFLAFFTGFLRQSKVK